MLENNISFEDMGKIAAPHVADLYTEGLEEMQEMLDEMLTYFMLGDLADNQFQRERALLTHRCLKTFLKQLCSIEKQIA